MVGNRLTAARFHEELVSAFLGAEYLVSCVLRQVDPAELVDSFYDLRDAVDSLASDIDLIVYFQGERQRVAAAAGESPIVIDPLGAHHPSYHDAAFAMVDRFLNDFMIADLDKSGVIRRWWIFPEVIDRDDYREEVKPWKSRFDGILSEYQANLRLEAVQILIATRTAMPIGSQSTGNGGTNNCTNTNRLRKTPTTTARDLDVQDLWAKLKSDDRPRAEVAREFTRETVGSDPKAKSLLAEIDRRKRTGKLS